MCALQSAMDSNTSKRDNTRPSCAICQRRKVKCNRNYPCDSCIRSGLECSYRGRTRKRQRVSNDPLSPAKEDLSRNAAELLSVSLSANTLASHPESMTTSSPSEAHLVSDGRGYRYVNNYIWNALPKQTTSHASSNAPGGPQSSVRTQSDKSGDHDNLNYPQSATGSNPSRNFILGSGYFQEDRLQLQPHHVVTLWQKYMQNVDPVMKVVHVPTVQQLVLGQVGKSFLHVNDRSLVSSIFFVSAVSMTDSECNELLQNQRDRLVLDLREATEQALSSANFVTTTEIVVLQALVLYLAALRSLGETQAVWSILGIVARIAGTLGVARDGSVLNLPPFECEMRRRLWWTLVYLDARTAELVGQDVDLLVQKFEVLPPSNLSDSELFPAMKRAPKPRPGATEAIYIVQKATYGSILHSVPILAALTRGDSSITQSTKALDEIENLKARFNDEFLQHCDQTVPIQWFTIIAGKMIIAKLLLVAKSPSSAVAKSDMEAFTLSLELMELHLSLWSEPSFQQWQWYSISFFPWHAFISLIRQTRLCEDRLMATKGWTVIRKVLDIVIPTIEIEPKKSLLLEAIKSLLTTAMTAQSPRIPDEQERIVVLDTISHAKNHAAKRRLVSSMPWAQEHGSRPHDALLPGLSTSADAPPAPAHTTSRNDDNLFMFDFALDTMDWDEFDRLVSGLDS